MALKSILDPSFKYRSSRDTDITITWERRRKQMEAEQSKREDLKKKMEQIPHIGKKQA
jgi:hypothetical protein